MLDQISLLIEAICANVCVYVCAYVWVNANVYSSVKALNSVHWTFPGNFQLDLCQCLKYLDAKIVVDVWLMSFDILPRGISYTTFTQTQTLILPILHFAIFPTTLSLTISVIYSRQFHNETFSGRVHTCNYTWHVRITTTTAHQVATVVCLKYFESIEWPKRRNVHTEFERGTHFRSCNLPIIG